MPSLRRPGNHRPGFPSGNRPLFAARMPAFCARAKARRAGFATILILMLLFMMLLMVITYLRVMRSYAMTHSQMASNATPILKQLEMDLAQIIGADGKIGPTAQQPYDADPTKNKPGQVDCAIHEPYDYPWTCTTQFRNFCRVSYPNVQTSYKGMGDPYLDDAWLAPLETGAGGRWAQVSNIFGSFLVYNDAVFSGIPKNASTGDFVPPDAPAGHPIPTIANGQWVDYQGKGTDPDAVPAGLDSTDPRLVDTDGDGIGDALWFYPKNNVSGGLRYVAAVRVVDLSGCLNLNTALGELATAPDTQSGTPRKGEGPYEVDASKLDPRFSFSSAANSKTFRAKYAAATGQACATSWDFWRNSGALVNDDGTSCLPKQPPAPAPAVSPYAARYGLTDEIQIRDLTGKVIASNALLPGPTLFSTASATGDYGALPPATAAGYALRNRITTISGAYDRSAPVPFSGNGSITWTGGGASSCNFFTGRTHRAGDLNLYQMDSTGLKNKQWWDSTLEDYFFFYAGSYPAMEELLHGVDSTSVGNGPSNPNSSYPFPQGFKTLVPTASDRGREFQIQMGVCLQDALERDNRPTAALSWMGWKPLPLLTEFYGEMPYVATSWDNAVRVNTTAVTVFKNTTLAQLKTVKAKMDSVFANEYNVDPYFWNTSVSGKITFQLQQYRPSDNLTRAGLIELAQSGSDVTARCLWYHYATGNACGQDFTTLGVTLTGATTTTADGGAGWANQLFDLLVPVDQGSGTWADIFINTQNARTTYSANTASVGDTRYGAAAGIGSYAFEVANPYSIPIRLANVRFQFRGQDYPSFDAMGCPKSTSSALDTYITSGATAPALPKKDAEGFFVLKPGEKMIFFRNGTENTNSPSGSTDNASYYGTQRPNLQPWQRFNGGPTLAAGSNNVDLMATLFPSGLPANTYAVNLGTDPAAAPDWNGHYNNRQMEHIELQANAKLNDGTISSHWIPFSRLTYLTQPSGYKDFEIICEGGVPAGGATCPLPGTIVYRQVDARTFGVDQKLNLLQARPPVVNTAYGTGTAVAPTDFGDEEMRTNQHANAGSGATTTSPALKPYSNLVALPNGWAPGYQNTSSTQPLSASYANYTTGICKLGQDIKVSFPGPSATNPIYGGQSRQDIKAGSLFFNYMGLTGSDATAYPGTFPELAASLTGRDNANANATNGKERRDGIPRVMDIGKILMVGPVYNDGSWSNTSYRGGSGFNANPSVDQLAVSMYQNTIGDAINFHLAKDTAALGLKGLCLRADKPFYDPAQIFDPRLANKTLAQLYAALDATQSAFDGLPAPPAPPAADPDAATRVQYSQDLATYRAGIRGMANWQLSWADVFANYFQVDGPKYKGCMGSNGPNFKPGTININTAPQAVLQCMSFPKWLTDADPNAAGFAAGIVAARQGPRTAAGTAILIPDTGGGTTIPRKGLAMVSELRNQDAAAFGAAVTNGTLLSDAASWLPQQASCRSDVYCAYIILQGYKQDNFNLGPMDVRRAIVIYSRDTSGSPANKLQEFITPNQ